MILDALGKWDLEHYRPAEEGYVGYLHWHLRPPGGRVVFLYRDPRDTVISLSALHTEFGGIDGVLGHFPPTIPFHTIAAIGEELEYWLGPGDPDCVVRFENLDADPARELVRVTDALGIECVNSPAEVAARHTLEITVAKFRLGAGEQTARAPLAGPGVGLWQDRMAKDQGKWIEEHVGHWLRRLDYETSPDWWRALPAR